MGNVIIFGAGASYGSDDAAFAPPLGSNLFHELVKFNPDGWGAIPINLSARFRDDFERGMEELSKNNAHWMPPLQRAMAAYFFRFLPRTSNLYLDLSRRLKQSSSHTTLVTFNYERLLELSLLSQELRPVVGKEQASANEIELCLPHGCCHLFCEAARGLAKNISFMGTAVKTSGAIKVIGNQQEFSDRVENDAFPPVMSYFEPKKETTSGYNFIDVSAKKTYLFKGKMNWLNTTLGDNEICEHTNFVCIQQRNKKRRCRLIFGFPRIFGMICWS